MNPPLRIPEEGNNAGGTDPAQTHRYHGQGVPEEGEGTQPGKVSETMLNLAREDHGCATV